MFGRSRVVGPRLRAAALLLGLGVSLTSSGCITETGRCSKNQVSVDGDFLACECAPGYVLSRDRVNCVACGEHARADGSRCVCETGYARANDAAACEKVEGSIAGSTCSETEPCTDPNPHCAEADSERYCTTSGCARHADCPAMWRCATSGATKYCQKPPTGLGDKCDSAADCAGKEAKFCEFFMTHECMVNDCARAPNICPSQYACCDLSQVVNESLCVPTSFLTDGMCPVGGKLVTP